MKQAFLFSVCFAAILMSMPVHALELAGVNVPEKMVVAERSLQLNGAGIRKKLMFEVYVASLYTVAKTSDAAGVLTSSAPRRMQLNMLRTVEAASLYQALLEGLQNNVSAAQLKEFAPSIAELEKIFLEIKTANKGDVIGLDIVPGQGTKILVRGRQLGLIGGDVFASALLSIWLGKVPVSEDLKSALLSKA